MVANTIKHETGGYRQTFGVSFRQIFDLGNVKQDTYGVSTGQSGHFMNKHYDDMMEKFVSGYVFSYESPLAAKGLVIRPKEEDKELPTTLVDKTL